MLAAALSTLLAAPVAAEPLQILDTLDADDIPGGLDQLRTPLLARDDLLVVLASGPLPGEGRASRPQLLLLERDPDTGRVAFADRIGAVGAVGEPGYREPDRLGVAVSGEALYLTGRASPDGCTAPCAVDRVILAYALGEDGAATFVADTDVSGFSDGQMFELAASPDGRHLYVAGSQYLRSFAVQAGGELVEIDDRLDYGDANPSRGNYFADFLLAPDGELAFASVGTVGTDPGGITTFRRDADTGLLRIVSTIEGDDEVPLQVHARLALAPDGRTLYATSWDRSDRGAPGGVLRFDVGTDGALAYVGIDTAADDAEPGTGERPEAITLTGDGRQLFVFDSDQYLHKYTVDADGALVYRGYETNDEDGVEPTAFVAGSRGELVVAPDGSTVTQRTVSGTLSTFDARADLALSTGMATSPSTDERAVTRRLVLFNAGPATAHGIELEIVSDTAIESVSLPGVCTVEGTSARCEIDRLGANASLELDVTAMLDADGGSALEATGAAIELDPDETDNRARLSVSPGGMSASPNESAGAPVVVAGDGAGDDGGGGCSIGGTGRSDSLLALLLGAALFGTLRRRRPVRVGREHGA